MLMSLQSVTVTVLAQDGSSTTGTTTVINTNPSNGLEVGKGNTIIIDFGSLTPNSKNSSIFNITGGAFNNKGTVYLISTNPNITSGTLNLSGQNVNNYSIITSANIPSSLLSSLNLINLVSNFSFSFTGVNNFTNAAGAVVSSAGSLSIAANQITNAGSIMANNALNLTATNIINNSGIMQAAQTASLAAAQILNSGTISSINNNVSAITASLQNSNLIQALNGSVFVRNELGSALNINNTLGKIIAKNESIFEVLNGSGDLTVKGGLIKSNTITMNAYNADLDVNVLQLAGGLIANAHNITIMTEQGDLNIISINAGPGCPSAPPPLPSGNSTFIALDGDLNLGNIFFDGPNYVPNYSTTENFIAIASRDIISTADNKAAGESVNTNGANVVLKAGWDYNAGKAAASGGSIRLPNISFNTDGGNFEAQAYKPGINFTGTIDLGNVNTSASSPGKAAGSVNIQAASHVATGNISAIGAAGTENGGAGGSGGNITVVSQAGIISAGEVLSMGGDGGKWSNPGIGGTGSKSGDGGAGGNAGDILLNGSRGVHVTSVMSVAGNGGDARSNGVGNPHNGNGGNGGKGGVVSILAGMGGITFEGPVGSQGGDGGRGLAGGTGGDAGNVTLSSRLDIANKTQTDIFAVGGKPGMGKFGYNVRGGNGGDITLSTLTNIYLNSATDIVTNGYGSGQHAGNINLSARGGYYYYLMPMEEEANIQIYPYDPPIRPMPPYFRGGNIVVGNLDASGRLGADGGNVSSNSGNLKVGSGSGSSVSVDASSYTGLSRSEYGKGDAGNVLISTSSGNRFVVGNNPKVNGTAGMILANGFNGGRIELRNAGGQHVKAGSGITANGTDGKGGNILFSTMWPIRYPIPRIYPIDDQPHIMLDTEPDTMASSIMPPDRIGFIGGPPLDTIIDGFVQATNNKNDSGRIGFHSGPGRNLTLTGAGKLDAGEFISIGNLNTSTLELSSVQAGVLSPYPPFALLVVHGAVKCNAGNCGTVAEVRALGVSNNSDNTIEKQINSQTFPDLFTAINSNDLSSPSGQLPGTDLINRHINISKNESDNATGSKPNPDQGQGTDGDAGDNKHSSLNWQSEDGSEFLPVSKTDSNYVSRSNVPEKFELALQTFSHGEARYLSDTAVINQIAGVMKLSRGDLLVHATVDNCKVKAGNCLLELRKGTTVMLSVSNKLVKIQNVHEHSLESCKVHFAAHNAKLSAGEELVIADSAARIKSAMQDDLLGRRKTQSLDMNRQNYSMSKGEFSIASLMQNSALLKRIYSSPDKSDRLVISKIMKMHACLNQVTSAHGIFRPISN